MSVLEIIDFLNDFKNATLNKAYRCAIWWKSSEDIFGITINYTKRFYVDKKTIKETIEVERKKRYTHYIKYKNPYFYINRKGYKNNVKILNMRTYLNFDKGRIYTLYNKFGYDLLFNYVNNYVSPKKMKHILSLLERYNLQKNLIYIIKSYLF